MIFNKILKEAQEMKTRRLWIILPAIVLLIFAVQTGWGQDMKMDKRDMKFVQKAASGGMMEVAAGEMASKNAAGEEVRNFGARMVQDHGQANQRLMEIAKNKGVQAPDQMSKKHARMIDRLAKRTGADFDREYMKLMVKDHREGIKMYEKQAREGKDPDLKAFAESTLPTLREHLNTAMKIQQTMGKEK